MRFDPATPLAVFLGPSLAHEEARARLCANYYPPVRMGDVYRLLATGVRRIAIIDGVFHHSTPVWQRELLAALDEGIEVVGGASMGALRAAELAPFGMRGIGTVYDWYRDGIIDGDDEVALLHTDAELGYRALSEPLVNLRYNLERACVGGVLEASVRDTLIADLQSRCFRERSWDAVFDAAAALGLPGSQCAALRQFVATRLVDIKRVDALAVLAHCATPFIAPATSPRERWSYPGDAVRPLLQSACADDGELVSGAQLLEASLGDTATIADRECGLRRRFFLLAAFEALAGAEARAGVAQHAVCVPGHLEEALRRGGLSRAEFARECAERARIESMVGALPLVSERTPPAATTRREREDAWIAAWAHSVGIVGPGATPTGAQSDVAPCAPPADGVDTRAFVDWLVDRGPHFFGYTAWNARADLLRGLRFDGLGAGRAQAVDA